MARRMGRAMGLNRLIAACFRRGGYEVGFDQLLTGSIRPGDCVWDVGANVGRYTAQFAARAGEGGSVYAFEPSPVNFARLSETCAGAANVHLLRCALGEADGQMRFEQGGDDLGATSRIVEQGGQVVAIRAGDCLIADGSAAKPNVLKIDVEGFECEVLDGMHGVLADPRLRTVGVEVHFGRLEERGLRDGPRRIERLLRDASFRVDWPDGSHIVAMRGT
jgi:FkbM family methyltransferase